MYQKEQSKSNEGQTLSLVVCYEPVEITCTKEHPIPGNPLLECRRPQAPPVGNAEWRGLQKTQEPFAIMRFFEFSNGFSYARISLLLVSYCRNCKVVINLVHRASVSIQKTFEDLRIIST